MFLVLFKDVVRRVSLGFHLFVSGVNQGNEKAVWIQDFPAWPQEWKDSHLDLILGYWTISKNIIFFESEKCHMRRLFGIYWKLIYLLEGVGRVVTGMQLGGRVGLPCFFSKTEKKYPDFGGKKKCFDEIFIKLPKFQETSPSLKKLWWQPCLIKKKCRAKRRKRAPENPVGLSLYDGPIKTVEYIWVNIWWILDWILSQNCRNTLPLHTVNQLMRSPKNHTVLWLAIVKRVWKFESCKA